MSGITYGMHGFRQFYNQGQRAFGNCIFLGQDGVFFEVEYLEGIDFVRADLTGQNFQYMSLDHVNFQRANLTKANFTYTTLYTVDFTSANLQDSDFTGTTFVNCVDVSSCEELLSRGAQFSPIMPPTFE